ncbi:MAG TPA: putative sulfate exporter family transporter [Candidatus Polarisedimenticolia bacterium]|nr:putative sulfate exporter family transporter [Candidatus Polarisedimenticolia bacterium]
MIGLIPGIALACALSFLGQYLAGMIGIDLLGLPRSPISPIMMAIVLGVLLRNTIRLPPRFAPGVRFCLIRILRIGIVLLGIRLSLGEVGRIGLRSLPVIVGSTTVALLIVTWVGVRAGLTARLGTLIAVGTSICGATAIVATAPTIDADDDEVSYSVACITLFGMIAMLAYPFVAHWWFSADAFRSGLFLGTAVHETAQVVGSGLVYQEYFGEPAALDAATVTKLVRNLGMLVIIPLMSILYHRGSGGGATARRWWSMIPLFVLGFAGMSLLRTLGDLSDPAFGLLDTAHWKLIVGLTNATAEICLGIAMAAVGLGTSIAGLRKIGLRPLGVGFLSAILVGAVSIGLIAFL